MKLRNKKTGEIDDFLFEVISERIDLYRRVGTSEAKNIWRYNSLAELNEEWEDAETDKKTITLDKNQVQMVQEGIAMLLSQYKMNGLDLTKETQEIVDKLHDYKPKEPLIKDEKIRKVVRAWANSFDDVDEIKASDDYKEFWIDCYIIGFERSSNEMESVHTYRRTNIAELCGVEE